MFGDTHRLMSELAGGYSQLIAAAMAPPVGLGPVCNPLDLNPSEYGYEIVRQINQSAGVWE